MRFAGTRPAKAAKSRTDYQRAQDMRLRLYAQILSSNRPAHKRPSVNDPAVRRALDNIDAQFVAMLGGAFDGHG